jgi:MurNAc alpha-1-phosphate uridylyltransferase
MIERFDAAVADMVLLCVHPRDATGFRRSHDFCLDPRGRLTKDIGAPVIYSGVALVSRSIVAAHESEVFSLYALIEQSLESERLLGVALGAPWFHVGDPAALALAEDVLRS